MPQSQTPQKMVPKRMEKISQQQAQMVGITLRLILSSAVAQNLACSPYIRTPSVPDYTDLTESMRKADV